MQTLTQLLTTKTTLNQNQIKNILTLLDKGDTIPFIARYRKELTGGIGHRGQVNVIVLFRPFNNPMNR